MYLDHCIRKPLYILRLQYFLSALSVSHVAFGTEFSSSFLFQLLLMYLLLTMQMHILFFQHSFYNCMHNWELYMKSLLWSAICITSYYGNIGSNHEYRQKHMHQLLLRKVTPSLLLFCSCETQSFFQFHLQSFTSSCMHRCDGTKAQSSMVKGEMLSQLKR